ncbi:type IV toxin-antitoxin system AbiEi family antitoxin [Microbacterium sp.]|uniref:type IV toxin-antitoxin system AbiEi family antitoxin n=1 Tax=Microbacterium sp. TaxID=51671 RepID=UPI003C779B33
MLTLTTSLALSPSPVTLLRGTELPHPERAVARGDVVRVRAGVFAPAAQWRRLRPWERYLARVHAVALVRPDAIFCHESAAVLVGMPVVGDPVTVHVLVAATEAARESAGIRSHRAAALPDLITVGGIVVTTPAVTAVTLARYRHHALGLAATDAALRLDPLLSRDALSTENESRPTGRGRNTARWALTRASAQRESALESLSDAVREWLGFPAPELQHAFVAADGTVDRGDQWWENLGLLGEPDGEFKYDGRFGDPAGLLRKRRERDRRLLSGPVAAIAHWGWIEVARVWPLRDLLVGFGLPQLLPVQIAPLRSLMKLLQPYDRLLSRDDRIPRVPSDRERTTRRRENG